MVFVITASKLAKKEDVGMTIQNYLTSLKNKRVAVIGIGVSNTPLIKMLLRAGIGVTACDRCSREDLGGVAEELESLGATLRLGEGYLEGLERQDVIFRTPGLRPDVPELERARAKGAVVTSEMEVFFRRHGQRREDHHYHHYRRAAQGGGVQCLRGRQHRQAPAA